ncbi:hypothetical protein [Nocardia sp. NPDC004711]
MTITTVQARRVFAEPMVSSNASAVDRTVRGGTVRIRVTVPAIVTVFRACPG